VDPGSLLLLAVTLGLVFMIVSRGRKQQREVQAVQAALVPGVEVMTSSGLQGTLVELTDDGTAVLEVAPGVTTRWDRRAIARVIQPVAVEEPARDTEDDSIVQPAPGAVRVESAAPTDRD
jgi:preprotein translocase subunit YajC